MEEHTRPYEYGGEQPDADIRDDNSQDAETVIVDGQAMTFRSYRSYRSHRGDPRATVPGDG